MNIYNADHFHKLRSNLFSFREMDWICFDLFVIIVQSSEEQIKRKKSQKQK